MRLATDGNVKACLFGNDELSLRDAIRAGGSDEDLVRVVQDAVWAKKEKLGGHETPEAISKGTNRPMILIVG
jgi:molybdenum cofactor biosynthesis enzyme MoaA